MSSEGKGNSKPIIIIMAVIAVIILILLLLRQCAPSEIKFGGSEPKTTIIEETAVETVYIDGPVVPLSRPYDTFFFRQNLPEFTNETVSNNDLDDLAKELLALNLGDREVDIQGYAAYADNNIDPYELSKKRAEFIIDGLVKRGLAKSLFTEPKPNGSVNFWGDNSSEEQQHPNRRVMITVRRKIATPQIAGDKSTTGQTAIIEPGKPGTIINLQPVSNLLLIILIIAFVILGIILLLLNVDFAKGGGSPGPRVSGKSSGSKESHTNFSRPAATVAVEGEWIPPTPTYNNQDYRGGYYGDNLKTPGRTPHHIPSNMAINKGFGLTGLDQDVETRVNGWTPAIQMDEKDHEYTTSYKTSSEGTEYQAKQISLIQQGKIMEALKMDIDDVLRIQNLRELGNKYIKGLYGAVYHMYILLTIPDNELQTHVPDYAIPILLKSRSNPANKILAVQKLKELWNMIDKAS